MRLTKAQMVEIIEAQAGRIDELNKKLDDTQDQLRFARDKISRLQYQHTAPELMLEGVAGQELRDQAQIIEALLAEPRFDMARRIMERNGRLSA
jgi:hypothetical protein